MVSVQLEHDDNQELLIAGDDQFDVGFPYMVCVYGLFLLVYISY